jgi:transposase
LDLAAGTVTGGFKRVNDLLEPLYTGIAEYCRGEEYWNADETTWRVFGTDREKWWLWIIAADDAIVYVLDPSRSSKVPSDFFTGSVGTLMTDRYSAYKGLHDGILKAWCWVHVRRDFLRIYEGIPKLRRWAKKWLSRIAELFALAEERFGVFKSGYGFGKEWDVVQEKVRLHLQRMREDYELEVSEINLDKERKKVLSSLKRHWAGLTLFLSDPRIPLHNNRAERLLRNSVILRKNSYGSGSEWAGEFAARLFSILQTWLVNGLDPEALLESYLTECSKPGRSPPDVALFLPWKMSSARKELFALPKAYSHPG